MIGSLKTSGLQIEDGVEWAVESMTWQYKGEFDRIPEAARKFAAEIVQ